MLSKTYYAQNHADIIGLGLYYTFSFSKNYDGLLEYLLYSDFSFCYQSHHVEDIIWLYTEDVINTAMRHLLALFNLVLLNKAQQN